MANIEHCTDVPVRASVYRLASNLPAYTYQHAYHGRRCKKCGNEFIVWQGEYPDGHRTAVTHVDEPDFDAWIKRFDAKKGDIALPEPQLMSEYSERVASGNMDAQIHYSTKLCNAHRWYQGKRVDYESL